MTMRIHFDEDIQQLRGKLLEMGGICEEMIQLAVKGLTERDDAYQGDVAADEERVNQLHIDIDELCLRLIALHQPAAGDLRLIAAALKINSYLERIGDQAVNISETSSFLSQSPRMNLGDIPRMVELASSMVKDSLDAFARRDVDLAR